MEVWDILDENGDLTGKTMNKGDSIVWQEGIYHQGVDVWIINCENKILIQKRAAEKRFEPNVWAMTGGCVIKGESILNALKREVLEELGIKLDIAKAIKIKRYRTENIWLDVYVVKQDVNLNEVVIQKEEVSEVKFATFSEIERLYKDDMFMKNRWEFVREEIKKYIGG